MAKEQQMKTSIFEHKSHALLPFRKFVLRVANYFLLSISLIAVSLLIGTLGYYYFGGVSWIDAFYNASMILTGMGPVNPMLTVAGKLFSSFYALFSGIAFLSTVAVLFAPIAHRFLHILHLQENEKE